MKFISREHAGLRPARGYTELSSGSATAHWGGGGPDLIPHEQCTAIWRAWQAQHMDTDQLAPGGAADIAYNMGACQHGWSLEGRGANRRSAANGRSSANGLSFAIVYIGGSAGEFTDEARDAYNDCADYLGAELDYVHQDWTSTSCPGDTIIEWVRNGHPRHTPLEGDDFLSALTDEEQREMLAILRSLREKTQFTNDVLHRIVGPFHPTGDAYGGAEGYAGWIVWMGQLENLIWESLNEDLSVRNGLPSELDLITDRVLNSSVAQRFTGLSDEPYDMSKELAAGD